MINIENLVKRLHDNGHPQAKLVRRWGEMYDGEIFISEKTHIQVGVDYVLAAAFSAAHGAAMQGLPRTVRQIKALLEDISIAEVYEFTDEEDSEATDIEKIVGRLRNTGYPAHIDITEDGEFNLDGIILVFDNVRVKIDANCMTAFATSPRSEAVKEFEPRKHNQFQLLLEDIKLAKAYEFVNEGE